MYLYESDVRDSYRFFPSLSFYTRRISLGNWKNLNPFRGNFFRILVEDLLVIMAELEVNFAPSRLSCLFRRFRRLSLLTTTQETFNGVTGLHASNDSNKSIRALAKGQTCLEMLEILLQPQNPSLFHGKTEWNPYE